MKGKLLIEKFFNDTVGQFQHTIIEGLNKQKKVKVIGPVAVCEKKNKNGRFYQREEMLKEVEKFNKLCDENHLSTRVGIDHPPTSELPLKESAGRFTKIWESITEQNTFYGEVELFANSNGGSIIMDMINSGMYPGFSTRALGNIVETGSGKRVDGLQFISADFVSDPSAEVYAQEQKFESTTYEYQEGLLTECVEDNIEKVNVQEVVVEAFSKAFQNLTESWDLKEVTIDKKLKDFYEDLVDINGEKRAKNIVGNIANGKIPTFNADLKELGFDVKDIKVQKMLKELIK